MNATSADAGEAEAFVRFIRQCGLRLEVMRIAARPITVCIYLV